MKNLNLLDQLIDTPDLDDSNLPLPADRFDASKDEDQDSSLDHEKRVIIALCEFWALLG